MVGNGSVASEDPSTGVPAMRKRGRSSSDPESPTEVRRESSITTKRAKHSPSALGSSNAGAVINSSLDGVTEPLFHSGRELWHSGREVWQHYDLRILASSNTHHQHHRHDMGGHLSLPAVETSRQADANGRNLQQSHSCSMPSASWWRQSDLGRPVGCDSHCHRVRDEDSRRVGNGWSLHLQQRRCGRSCRRIAVCVTC